MERQDVLEFLGSLKNLKVDDVAFRYKKSRQFSGLAFVKLANKEEMEECLTYHKKDIIPDQRYVEVFVSSKTEFKSALNTKEGSKREGTAISEIASKDNGFMKVRGLPFDSTLEDIQGFFADFELFDFGVYRSYYRDRPDGQCWVVFKDEKTAEEA